MSDLIAMQPNLNIPLYLVAPDERRPGPAWKGQDWGAMDRLHQKGYISNPKSKALSVAMTETGAALSKELFFKYFEAKE